MSPHRITSTSFILVPTIVSSYPQSRRGVSTVENLATSHEHAKNLKLINPPINNPPLTQTRDKTNLPQGPHPVHLLQQLPRPHTPRKRPFRQPQLSILLSRFLLIPLKIKVRPHATCQIPKLLPQAPMLVQPVLHYSILTHHRLLQLQGKTLDITQKLLLPIPLALPIQ